MMPNNLHFLLREAYQNNNVELQNYVNKSLTKIAYGGVFDHVGEGFSRYSVDDKWHVPHFEKMLYDNALLAHLYLRASKVFNRPDYEIVARETLDFMISEMLDSKAAMVASFSAVDDANVEGGYYLWDNETLSKLLNTKEMKVTMITYMIYISIHMKTK